MMRTLMMIAALALFAATGCVEQPKDLTKEQLDSAKPYISTTKPTPENPLDINFEDYIALIGYDLSPKGIVKPGSTLTVTWYWQCKKKLDDGWLLFTHVEDAKTSPRINADNEGVIRKNYPPGKWKVGEFIKDVQRVAVPADWDSPTLTFYIGIWFGPHRLQVKKGDHDKENRARALVLQTSAKPKEGLEAKLEVYRAEDPIKVDGKLDEKTWATAKETTMVDPVSGGKMFPKTAFKAAWDEENLYVAFMAEDDQLECTFSKRDDPLYDQDAVEVFLDPDGDQKNYFEFEVSPSGLIFDSKLAEYRKNDNAWNGAMVAKVVADGTMNKAEDVDKSWTAEIAIPLKDLGVQSVKAGDKWRANFFRLDTAKAGRKAFAWSAPRNNDFHNLDKFGTLVFADKPPAEPEAATTAPAEGETKAPAEGTEPGKAVTIKPAIKKLALPPKGLPAPKGTKVK